MSKVRSMYEIIKHTFEKIAEEKRMKEEELIRDNEYKVNFAKMELDTINYWLKGDSLGLRSRCLESNLAYAGYKDEDVKDFCKTGVKAIDSEPKKFFEVMVDNMRNLRFFVHNDDKTDEYESVKAGAVVYNTLDNGVVLTYCLDYLGCNILDFESDII